MQDWLIWLVNNHAYLVYLFIILFACAEGPILSILSGLLIKAGYFSFLPVYIALMFGDLIGDVVWYYLGHKYGGKIIGRFGKYINITEDTIGKATRIFHAHKDKILIISKVTNGFGLALVTLVTAGIVRIPFGRYITFNVMGQFIWSGILIAAGYYFGHFYEQFDNIFARTSLIALAVVIFLAFHGYTKYLQKKLNTF